MLVTIYDFIQNYKNKTPWNYPSYPTLSEGLLNHLKIFCLTVNTIISLTHYVKLIAKKLAQPASCSIFIFICTACSRASVPIVEVVQTLLLQDRIVPSLPCIEVILIK